MSRILHSWLVALVVTWTIVGLLVVGHIVIGDGLLIAGVRNLTQ